MWAQVRAILTVPNLLYSNIILKRILRLLGWDQELERWMQVPFSCHFKHYFTFILFNDDRISVYNEISVYSENLYIYILPRLKNSRCPNVVNFITLPPELSKSFVKDKKLLYNVNILNSFHIFRNNSLKYVLLYI